MTLLAAGSGPDLATARLLKSPDEHRTHVSAAPRGSSSTVRITVVRVIPQVGIRSGSSTSVNSFSPCVSLIWVITPA